MLLICKVEYLIWSQTSRKASQKTQRLGWGLKSEGLVEYKGGGNHQSERKRVVKTSQPPKEVQSVARTRWRPDLEGPLEQC